MEGVWPSSCVPSTSQLSPGAGPAQTSSGAWGPARLLLRPEPAAQALPGHTCPRPQGGSAPSGPNASVTKGGLSGEMGTVPGPLRSPGMPGARGGGTHSSSLPSSPARSLRAVRGQLRALLLPLWL